MTPRLWKSPCLMPVAKELHQLWWHLLSMAPRNSISEFFLYGAMEFSGYLPPQGNKALLVQKSFFPPSSPFKKATIPWGSGDGTGGGLPFKSHFHESDLRPAPIGSHQSQGGSNRRCLWALPKLLGCWVVWILQTLLGVGAPLGHPW